MSLMVIDTETTGTNPEKDRICEIAGLMLGQTATKEIFPIRSLSHLCNPGIPIPPKASAVHHILDCDVAGRPSVEDVIEDFGADAYIAHNASFEKSFLDRLLGSPTWICTYRVALRVWPDAPGHSNQVLRYWLGHVYPFGLPRKDNDPHRALSDCYTTGAIFADLVKKQVRWSDMVKWSSEPALQSVIRFGKKHRGQRYDAVPADYLDWIVNQSDMDEDTKFSAQYWLNKRATT